MNIPPAQSNPDFDEQIIPFEDLWRMEDELFWHANRNRWILSSLREYYPELSPRQARFLEVGCGGGPVARALVSAGYEYVGVDTSPTLIGKAKSRLPQTPFFASRVEELPLEFHASFTAVGIFDVLEHLSDPKSLLVNAKLFLKPGGILIATVPARQSLYTLVDSYSGHKRRYENGELSELFRQAGFQNVRELGFFRVLLPFLIWQRKRLSRKYRSQVPSPRELLRENMQIPAKPVNWAMGKLCEWEWKLGRRAAEGKLGASQLVIGTRD